MCKEMDIDPVGRRIAAGIYGNRGLLNLTFNRHSEAAADFKQAMFIDPAIRNFKEALRRLEDSE